MSEQADLDELARRYLDLWQDQMSAVAADEGFARALQQIMTHFGLAAAAAPVAGPVWPAVMAGLRSATGTERTTDGEVAARARGSKGTTPPAAGPASAAAARDGGGVDLDELARRLAALEERVAALERGAGARRRGAARQPRQRRS